MQNLRPNARALSICGALATALLILASTSDAHALGPVDVEVGAKVGYATNPESSSPNNPYGLGLGARGGVVFLGGIYAGLNFMYYTGASNTVAGIKFSEHAVQYGLEAGYGFKIAILTLRPQVGFGNLTFSTSVDSSGAPAGLTAAGAPSSSYFYLEPGVVALVSLGLIYVGADLNLLLVPSVSSTNANGQSTSNTETSASFHAQVGVKF